MASLEAIVNTVVGRDHSSEVLSVDKFLGDDAIRLLAKKLTGNKLKRRIVLRGNCIGPTGAEALAGLLKDNAILTFMSLEWNQIGSEGTALLAGALATNTGLTHLDLRNNGVGDDGALALVEALTKNDSVKTLDLRWNQVPLTGHSHTPLLCRPLTHHNCCLFVCLLLVFDVDVDVYV
jgi:Ran GTPase-activating protein (RanGAP) involved in mRNA processing and transport